jgi:lipopolysaccharide export system protein LptA
MSLDYGPQSTPRKFSAYKTATRTAGRKEKDPPLLTWSNEFKADFDARGELSRIEQYDNFRFEEGPRRGSSDRAILDQSQDRITLDRNARFRDASGTVSADRIELAQTGGDIAAEGNVVSTRMPEKKKGEKPSAMLSGDEPLEARAPRMTTASRNQKIRYERGAVLWQGANRLEAETVDIDREERRLRANGKVRTQFADQQKPPPGKAPAFVVVDAEALDYREAERLAHYTGGVHLTRPGLEVTAREIRAFLSEEGAESSLDRVYADGAARILRTQTRRTLRTESEHAEYYAAEQKIVINGGAPMLEDSAGGITRGRELTYFAKEDKLLVDGAEKAPAVSRIPRKRK